MANDVLNERAGREEVRGETPSPALRLAAPFAVATFVGAFLLFLVQPLMGRVLLPALGGAPAVWATCLLFFQAALLAGYALAHGLARWLSLRGQVAAYLLLAGAAALVLPLRAAPPAAGLEASPGAILGWLAACIGPPYVVLAATSPLLQHWTGSARLLGLPYRLYALSNAASLLALASYPLAVEPWLGLAVQAEVWTGGYALFAAAALAGAGVLTWRAEGRAAPAPAADAGASAAAPPRLATRLLWLVLAALASALLMACTNHLCQDVAAVPLLWVLPLALYLLSFILVFGSTRPYRRALWMPLAGVALVAGAVALAFTHRTPIAWQVAVHGTLLLAACMMLHGELAARRPPVEHLTGFYLVVATGGALGGAFVALAAPLLFHRFDEYPLGLLAALVVGLGLLAADSSSPLAGGRPRTAWAGLVVAGWAVGFALLAPLLPREGEVAARSFFGVRRVQLGETDDGAPLLTLVHGGTVHGVQRLDGEARRWPTSYFGPQSGVGLALTELAAERGDAPLRVGVLGLGIGTLASYARPQDRYRFYEIDPLVVRIARERFHYLDDARGAVDVAVGDGRLVLAREVHAGAPLLDLLVLDAFTSDAVPVHLLTREAFALYWRRLAPGGVLAVNVSNRYLDLAPEVRAAVRANGGRALDFHSPDEPSHSLHAAHWVVASRDAAFLARARLHDAAQPWADGAGEAPFTDDYSNLLRVLR